MSRQVFISRSAQNGSLTSEPDSMSHNFPMKPGPDFSQDGTSRHPSSRSGSRSRNRQDKGPDTSTPVKSERKKPFSKSQSSEISSVEDGTAVRRNLEDELAACHMTNNGSVFEPGVKDFTRDSLASQMERQKNLMLHSGPNNSILSVKFGQDLSSTYGTSPTKKSFVSEYENGTIQAQRQELQLLITELKDRDRELNDMVKSHQEQLAGWEEDRQRLHHLEQKQAHSEGELKRKNDQIRALVVRLKTRETTEKEALAALENSRSELKTVTEQHNNSLSQLADTREKNRQLGSLVKDLSDTLEKLESKEHDLLSLVKQKENELNTASKNVGSMKEKLVSLGNKYKESQRECCEARADMQHAKDELSKYTSEVEKLKSDLNRSRQEEDESKMEIERGKREVERMKIHVKMMHEKEKRQEELISSQKKKQERTDSELSSLRLLYERQQRDMAALHMNFERTKELLIQQQHNNDMEQCNISLLLQSPTSKVHPADHHHSGENQPSSKIAHTFQNMDSDPLTTQKHKPQLKFQPVSNETYLPSLPPEQSDQGYVTGAPLTNTSGGLPQNDQSDSLPKSRDSKASRSGIPVRVDHGSSKSATPRPTTPVSQLNESIKDISEQSKKLAEIIEASRMKRAEDSNIVIHELAKQLAISKEKETLVNYESERTDISMDDNVTLSTSRRVTMRQYQYPYSGHFQTSGINVSHSPELQQRSSRLESPVQESREEIEKDGFATPPRTRHKSSTTPSPQQAPVSFHYVSTKRGEGPDHERSLRSERSSRVVSFQEDYSAGQYGQSAPSPAGQEGSYRVEEYERARKEEEEGWREELSDAYPNPGSPGLSSIRSEHSQDTSAQGIESPTSKLHRLLTESRQMVMTLERSTYPPFFPQETLSPIKPAEEEEERGEGM